MSEASIFGEGCGAIHATVAARCRVNPAKGLFGAHTISPSGDRTRLFEAAHERLERLQSKSSASFTART
jgi:hypothetical protein